jgi:hypothetical protein
MESDSRNQAHSGPLHASEDDLILHYYGELDAGRHLEECEACREAMRRLQRTMAAIDAAGVPSVDRGFEARVWQRFEGAIGRPAHPRSPHAVRAAWLAAAAALLIVTAIAAFMAGRLTSPAAPITVVREAPSDRVLVADLGAHLERAELALVELMNAEGQDLAGEQARAEDLVAANRLYREDARGSARQQVVDVLDELERVFIEVAAAPAAASLGVVRQRVDARGLLFKIRVMRESLREDASL